MFANLIFLFNALLLTCDGYLVFMECLMKKCEVVDLRLTMRNCSLYSAGSCWNRSLLSSKNCYHSVLVTHSGALHSQVRNAE